jgi:hypothetical protein
MKVVLVLIMVVEYSLVIHQLEQQMLVVVVDLEQIKEEVLH